MRWRTHQRRQAGSNSHATHGCWAAGHRVGSCGNGGRHQGIQEWGAIWGLTGFDTTAELQPGQEPQDAQSAGITAPHVTADHDMLEVALPHVVGDATVRAYHRSDMIEKRRKLIKDWA
jgi:hypothetical protein